MKKTLFMLFCLLCSIGAMAQKKTITGVVTDATGEAVIGASIVETGTTNGTVTDLDGNFTLSVANDGSIRVSFVGYQTQTLSVKGKSTFKIALKEDSEMLQEVDFPFTLKVCNRIWRQTVAHKSNQLHFQGKRRNIKTRTLFQSGTSLIRSRSRSIRQPDFR